MKIQGRCKNDNCSRHSAGATPTPARTGIEVAIAVVHRDRRWLVALRHKHVHLGGQWEFPGGKLQRAEHPADAALRELHEECRVTAFVEAILTTRDFDYGDRVVQITPVVCRWQSGAGEPVECAECRWVTWDELEQLEMPAANEGILEELRRHFRRRQANG